MNPQKTKLMLRERRRRRVRARVTGTAKRPRLSVRRTLSGMYVQLIDDAAGRTLLAVHTKTASKTGDAGDRKGKVGVSYLLGKQIAVAAVKQGITRAVFDRGGYRYHGRVQACAEGARDGGLQF